MKTNKVMGIMIYFFIFILILILIYPISLLNSFDTVSRPKKMEVEVTQNETGYIIKIINTSDYGTRYSNVNIESSLKWSIIDSANRQVVSSGNLTKEPSILEFNNSNNNSYIDVGDEFFIFNPSHNYNKNFFILERERIIIIHTKLINAH